MFLRTGGVKEMSVMTYYIADALRIIDNLNQLGSDTEITEVFNSFIFFFCLRGLFLMMKNEIGT